MPAPTCREFPAIDSSTHGPRGAGAALREDSIRLYEQMESGRVDAAVPSVFAADWMTIQIYYREAEALFID
jgi:hypothetical protein